MGKSENLKFVIRVRGLILEVIYINRMEHVPAPHLHDVTRPINQLIAAHQTVRN